MSDATTQPRSNTSAGTISGATIRADEAAHFGRLAKDWWDPRGSSAMLHRLNPVRLQFLREAIDLHWAGDPEDKTGNAFQVLALNHAPNLPRGTRIEYHPAFDIV